MADILHKLTIKASAQQIYRAITEQQGLSSWWTTHCQASPTINSKAQFSFNQGNVCFNMQIKKLIPDQAVSWYCHGGVPEWQDTQIQFNIRQIESNRCALHFTHSGWQHTEGLFPLCNFDWAYYLMSLRDYLETGQGFPATS